MSDKVDTAIAAASDPKKDTQLQIEVRVSTGRMVRLMGPADLTDHELLDLSGWVLTQFRGTLVDLRKRGRPSQIIVPHVVAPRLKV